MFPLQRPYLLNKHIEYKIEMMLDSNFVTTKEQNYKTCRLLPWLWLSFAYFLPRWPAASEQEEKEEEKGEEEEEEEKKEEVVE